MERNPVGETAIISWASGHDFCRLPEFNVFLQSIRRCGFLGDVILFSHDLDAKMRHRFKSMGYDVIEVNPDRIHVVVRDRFLILYEWLVDHGWKYNNIIMTDSKDVLFQRDPVEYINKAATARKLTQPTWITGDAYVMLCSEGEEHCRSSWNSINQVRLQQNVAEFEQNFVHRPIINSGFIIGTPEELKNLSILLWTNSIRTLDYLSEQATLNYLYFYLEKDARYELYTPQDCPLCITGEGIKEGWLDSKPIFKDGQLYYPKSDEPFYVFHQWDRTEYRDAILEQFV